MSDEIIRKSICDICTPGAHCGLDVHVRDGKIEKITGAKDFPSRGGLCMKGAANKDYVYQERRIRTPLRRIGERGDGRFEPISWEEALQETAERLLSIREAHGADSVAFYVGYEKWLRPWAERLAHSFGSVNYGTESSTCHFAAILAAVSTVGFGIARPDIGNTDLFIGWGCNPYVSMYQMARALEALKDRGGKIIMIDPRKTQTTEKLADLHLQIRPGMDGALMLGLANYFIEHDLCDMDYIRTHVSGFEAYRELAAPYTLERTSRITGLPEDQIVAMAELYGHAKKACAHISAASLTHHTNGFNSVRNLLCLQAIRGQIDRAGGNLPGGKSFLQSGCGLDSMEQIFACRDQAMPDRTRIGAWKYPLWERISREMQATDLSRQILEETPYPVHALVNFGMNHRMFPQPEKMLQAFQKLDFMVSADLFWTKTCEYSDIVLPACSSLERSELKAWPGGFLTCTTPAIPPLYESRPDTEIICDLARRLVPEDELLTAGYEETMRYLISPLSVSLEELKAAEAPMRMPEFTPYRPGTFLEHGFPTRSGKIELFSGLIKSLNDPALNPLPVYEPDSSVNGAAEQAQLSGGISEFSEKGSADQDRLSGATSEFSEDGSTDQARLSGATSEFSGKDADGLAQYPYDLVTGARLMHAIHSRAHQVPSLRKHRPEPCCELHPQTAAKEGICEGDWVLLSTSAGEIRVKAHLTDTIRPGDVHMYHGYEEADVNELIPAEWTDPYSGFPGYGRISCAIKKADTES